MMTKNDIQILYTRRDNTQNAQMKQNICTFFNETVTKTISLFYLQFFIRPIFVSKGGKRDNLITRARENGKKQEWSGK